MIAFLRSLLFFTLTLVILPLASLGQSEPESLKTQKNAVSLNILQIVAGELTLGYERLIWNRFSARVYGGYKYPYSNGPYQVNGSAFIRLDRTFIYLKGYRLGADLIYYLLPSFDFYLSAGFFYFHGFYNHLYYEFCTGLTKENYVYDQSYKEDQYRISTLIGKKMPLSGKNPRWQLDIFGGLGIVKKTEKTTVFRKKYDTCDCNSSRSWYIYDSPEVSNNDSWVPGLRLGLVVSYSF